MGRNFVSGICNLKETQLSLTNRTTRLQLIKITKYGTIPYVRYGFLLLWYSNFVRKMHHFYDIRLQKAVTLKTGLGVRDIRYRAYDFLLMFC